MAVYFGSSEGAGPSTLNTSEEMSRVPIMPRLRRQNAIVVPFERDGLIDIEFHDPNPNIYPEINPLWLVTFENARNRHRELAGIRPTSAGVCSKGAN